MSQQPFPWRRTAVAGLIAGVLFVVIMALVFDDAWGGAVVGGVIFFVIWIALTRVFTAPTRRSCAGHRR